MTDLDALYRAILSHPDDDTPRLIYADALEDVGESKRAAFIRTQVELARRPAYDPLAVRWEYHDRPPAIDPQWRLELPDVPGGLEWTGFPFRRGFPAEVKAENGAAFIRGAEELFDLAPVESLELGAVRAVEAVEPGPLAGCEWLSRLTRLSLSAGIGQAIARRLLRSPNLSRLTDLFIGGELTSPQTAAAVVGSPVFHRLRSLGYRDGPRGGSMVAELTRLADPPRLTKLDLAENRLTAERLARLVAAPAVAAAEDLDLSENNLGAAGLQALAAARLPHLRTLRLAQTWPLAEGVVALAESDAASNLRVLDLRDNRLGDAGAAALAGSPHLANLIALDLAGNDIEDTGADSLAESPHLGGLLYLGLAGNRVTPVAAKRLTKRFGEAVLLASGAASAARLRLPPGG